MTSLVLLQRLRPDSVYLACGETQELIARLCENEPLDATVEVIAEFTHMGHAVAQATEALSDAPCHDGWFDLHPGVALQKLGVCLGAAKPNKVRAKTILTRLDKDDRELIQAALKQAKTVGHAELCHDDRTLLHAI
jgi:hypothetical protein